MTRSLPEIDNAEFGRLVGPLRAELHAHCYRMLGSVRDADDALQEAMLRAWRGFDQLQSPGSLRSWLYTVATRTCLDSVERRGRRALPVDLGPASEQAVVADQPLELAWLGPYPSSPLAEAEQRESVELAFIAALQHLPGNQRAALLLTEVLAFSAAEVAEKLGTTIAAVNSALQRARDTVANRIPPISQQQTLRTLGDEQVQRLVSGYADALERGDAAGLIALLADDVTWSMPPLPHWYAGLGPVLDFARKLPLTSCGQWQHRLVQANAQPSVASYLRPEGAECFSAWSINVLTLRDGLIGDITSFIGPEHFTRFGLPVELT